MRNIYFCDTLYLRMMTKTCNDLTLYYKTTWHSGYLFSAATTMRLPHMPPRASYICKSKHCMDIIKTTLYIILYMNIHFLLLLILKIKHRWAAEKGEIDGSNMLSSFAEIHR